jgi:predicted nucleic acid-binding protein
MPVVDTSVIMTVMLSEPRAAKVEQWLESATDLHAPDFLQIEVVNALISARRRDRIDEEGVCRAFNELEELPFVFHSSERFLRRGMDICLRHHRRRYDALFIALAEQLEDPLVTCDRALVQGLKGSPLAQWVREL